MIFLLYYSYDDNNNNETIQVKGKQINDCVGSGQLGGSSR
jgi:hypothetical protein